MKEKDLPKIFEKSDAEIAAIIDEINNNELSVATKEFAISCIETAIWFPTVLQSKNISLNRLRKLIFGKGYKRGSQNNSQSNQNKQTQPKANTPSTPPADNDEQTHGDDMPTSTSPDEPIDAKQKPKGHGRMRHTVYDACKEIVLTLRTFQAGDPCPKECGGILRHYKPGILIRIKGQNFV